MIKVSPTSTIYLQPHCISTLLLPPIFITNTLGLILIETRAATWLASLFPRSLLAPTPSTIFLTVAGGIFEIFHPACGLPAHRVKPSSTPIGPGLPPTSFPFSQPPHPRDCGRSAGSPCLWPSALAFPAVWNAFPPCSSSPLAGVNVTVSPLLGEVFLGSRSYTMLFISVEEQRAPS